MSFTWNQVRDVVDAVLELPPEKRCGYLDQACPEPKLRRYVDSLLLSYENAGEFLEQPAVITRSPPWDPSWAGRRVGAYRLEEEIGQGGMGAVYRAVRDDEQFTKRVAVKLVKSAYDPHLAVTRFRAERQILAGLEHPNIARLLDGGTTEEGLPYFVMELVEGVPIDRYCDEHKLSIAGRLELFCTVCSAVQYAHQNLVIHRDLKPGNILITSDGTPKLLDFGIAKVLSPQAQPRDREPTLAAGRLLTPEYASPEQVGGGPITTASDVYSLGVMLYLLLTGRRPYAVESLSLSEMERVICEKQPVRPSALVLTTGDAGSEPGAHAAELISAARQCRPERLRRMLAGDLDNIVLMALRKEPGRRYSSPEQFSEDIRRYLHRRPVHAHQDKAGYRLQKFVARNKAGVATAVLFLLCLTAGLLVSLYEAHTARVQQKRAERRFQDVRSLANSLLFEIHDGISNLPGSTPVRKLMVERALKYLDSLAQDAKGDRSLEEDLATGYDKIGDVQGQPSEANLGDPAAAVASYEKALAVRQSLAHEDPGDARVTRDLVFSYIRLSDLLWHLGNKAQALNHAREEIPSAQKLSRMDPANPQSRLLVAMCHVDQGYKEVMLGGDKAAGVATVRQGAAMFEQMLADRPDDTSLRRRVALSYGRIAEIQRLGPTADDNGSLISFRKAIATLQPLLSQDPNNAEIRRLLAYYDHAVGELLGEMHQTSAAINQERQALLSFQKLASTDPANAQLQEDIAQVRGHIGLLLVKAGDAHAAIAELQQSLAALSKLAGAKDPQSYIGYAVITDQLWLGKAHVALSSRASLPMAQREAECRQALSWFNLCLPQFDSLRDTGTASDGEERVEEIHRDMSSCLARPQ